MKETLKSIFSKFIRILAIPSWAWMTFYLFSFSQLINIGRPANINHSNVKKLVLTS